MRGRDVEHAIVCKAGERAAELVRLAAASRSAISPSQGELGIREAAASRMINDVAASVGTWIDDLSFDVGLIRKVKRIVRNRQRLLG